MALVKQELVQFIGVKDLEPQDQLAVARLSQEYYPKIKRQLKNLTSLVVHVKQYEKGGSVKYALHARVIVPTRIFESCRTHDFDLARALHKSFKDLLSQIRHRLHTDEQAGHARKEGRPKQKASRADADIRGY